MNLSGDATNVNIIAPYTKVSGSLIVGGAPLGSDGSITLNKGDETLAATMVFSSSDDSLGISNKNAINIVSSDPDVGYTAQISAWANNGGAGSLVLLADAPSGNAQISLITDGTMTATASSSINIATTTTSINLDESSTSITLTAPNVVNIGTPSAIIQAAVDPSLIINNSDTSKTATYALGSVGQAHIEGSAGLGSTFLDVGSDISMYSPVNGVLVLNSEGYFNLLRPAYAELYSASSQSVNTSGVAITFSGISTSQSITSNSGVPSQIIFQYAGKYRFFYSIQLDKTGVGSGATNVWLKLNGSNITGTNKRITVPGSLVPINSSAEYILDIAAGDIAEIWFQSADGGVQTRAIPATTPFASSYSLVASINRIA